jgi:hypothetical protein
MLRFFGKKKGREHKGAKPRQSKGLRHYWFKHWEVIIAAIAAFIVGLLIVPMFFK